VKNSSSTCFWGSSSPNASPVVYSHSDDEPATYSYCLQLAELRKKKKQIISSFTVYKYSQRLLQLFEKKGIQKVNNCAM
jgi:hypothetical protein